jgi:hypothetical protein
MVISTYFGFLKAGIIHVSELNVLVCWVGCQRQYSFWFVTDLLRQALGPTQPPIQWVPGALSLVVKRSGREADLHVVPRSRMRGAIPPLPQHIFIARCLVKHRDNFTFTIVEALHHTYAENLPFVWGIFGVGLHSFLGIGSTDTSDEWWVL